MVAGNEEVGKERDESTEEVSQGNGEGAGKSSR